MEQLTEIEAALQALGDLLEERDQAYDLAVIGGGALMLSGLVTRPTEDLDVVAQIESAEWTHAKPLPEALRVAVKEVADVFDLPKEETHGKDWLNPGPAFLLKLGLPNGFEQRASTRTYGTLTLRIASRLDQIHLKLWAATASERSRKQVDIQDLKALEPSPEEIRQAAAWCARLDGRPDFVRLDVKPLLPELGLPEGLLDD